MKNLHLLSPNTMLNITERWLTDESFSMALELAGPLGVGIHQALVQAHDPLADLHRSRNEASSSLRSLIDLATQLDKRHDKKARGLKLILSGLAEAADTEAEAARFWELEGLLFPNGLTVTRLPYTQEGGAAVALERVVSDELRAELDGIVVGKRTLAQLLKEWLAAGHELGEVMQRRAELKAVLSSDGEGQLSLRSARYGWVKAVRALLWAIELDAGLVGLRERVEGVLKTAIAGDQSGRAGGGEGEELELGDGVIEEALDIEDEELLGEAQEELEDEDELLAS